MNLIIPVLLFLILAVAVITLIIRISFQVNMRLAQMDKTIQDANKIISQNLGSTAVVFGNVKEQLGRLEETNKQIVQISKSITSLQDLLRAPKFRGQMGEMLLENLLSQVLPKEYYSVQYRFKTSDTVDAVIKLGEHIVSIDAKFSLENFQKMIDSDDEQIKNVHRRKFVQDVKNRIDEIANKYILPQENTYDFALMYIPAENVYYEVIIKEDVFSYSMNRKVVPVSPNTFYAYLQVICLGLKGLKVEENAKEILKNINALSIQINKFKEDFDILGNHISNASGKYQDAQKRLEKFQDRIANIQDSQPRIDGS